MSTRKQLAVAASVLLFAALLGSPGARATTIIPFTDGALVDKAPIIVTGHVEGKLPNTTEWAITDWLVTVESVLKGTVHDGAIVIRTLGGEEPSGETLKIFGAPTFRSGETVLLFLRPDPDGNYRVFQFAQGAFHKIRNQNRFAAVQDLSEVHTARGGSGSRRARSVRDYPHFVAWVDDRANGTYRQRDYLYKPSKRQLQAIVDEFKLFNINGLNIRWFEFDSAESVTWKNNGGQVGLPSGGSAEFGRAMAVWNNEKKTPVRLVYGGTSNATGGLRTGDGQNTILFGDPNHEIDDVDCANGGTLALGGIRTLGQTRSFNGRNAYVASEGDIVVNNGVDCLFPLLRNPSKYVEHVFAHELGHTLGIAHSSENPNEPNATLRQALMYYLVYANETAGAKLNSDDIAALQALYKRGGRPAPPPPPGSCPANTLCLVNNRFEVTATWQNQFDGSSGVAGAIRSSDVAGYMYFTSPANYELIIKILDFGNVVKVFYGELTNLHFTITVRDKHTGSVKTYTNTPGDCGGLDENGFPSGAVIGQFAASRTGHHRGSQAGTCRPTAHTMCLLNDRFALQMNWRNQYDGSTGLGLPKKLTNLTGAFGFTSTANLELLIKTLDFGDHFLVIYGALSNLEYTLQVTDTVTGRSKSYSNPAGRYCGGLDPNF